MKRNNHHHHQQQQHVIIPNHHHHHHHLAHTLVVTSSSGSEGSVTPPSTTTTTPENIYHHNNNKYYDDDDDDEEEDGGAANRTRPSTTTTTTNCCASVVLVVVLLFILTCIIVTLTNDYNNNNNNYYLNSTSLKTSTLKPIIHNHHHHRHHDQSPPVTVQFDYTHEQSNQSSSGTGAKEPEIVSEYIHLYKLPPPLDNDDLSENLKRRMNNRFSSNHHYYNTGVFRPPNSRLWDPHPQYIFHAFNKRFHVVLNQISKQHSFLVPGFKVTTHRKTNQHESWVSRESVHNSSSGGGGGGGDDFEGCFYNGYVLGDLDSSVAVSLCGGMTGHIRTSGGSYFIEPRRYTNDLEHEIYKIVTQHHDDTEHHREEQEPIKNLRVTPYDYYSDEDYDSDEEEEEQETTNGKNARRTKRSLSTERYVELTVVTDQTMSRYHGDNLKHYVLTLLSIVALVYKDASIGNPVNIVLVNFHVLTDTDFSGATPSTSNGNSSVRGTSASEMLRNFCKWQKEHNHPDDRHALHHDTALLLTRETICRNPWVGKCDTLGLAELGTMCDHYASCAIVQDNGLSAAFTIAHELGHVMNMPHDDDYKCQGFVDKVEGFGDGSVSVVQHYVMSRMLDHNTYPWAWSRCSRHFLTEFLDAGHGYCLEDKPHSNLLSNDDENSVEESSGSTQQPGEIFSEHKQCELVFGPTSQLCSYMPPCRRLWCTNHGGLESEESEGCRTQHMPWADGTRCGANKWCQRGQCVLKDLEKLKVINGGWGEWENFGECSRPCGGGVRKSYRECDNPRPKNGGKYCVGPRVRYESCNTFECSNSSSGYDYRATQCGDYNGDNFNINGLPEDVIWVPKYNGISPKDRCKLFCRVQGSSSYYLLKDKVVDGTPCGIDTFDVCVNGACLPAGCDRRLHSTSTLDICGICGGDGSTCTTAQGSYNSTKYGYNLVVRIPSGASNIDIRQRSYDNTARDDNYLSLLDPLTSEYVLNGHFVVSMFRKTIAYGGSILEYSGSDQVVERINSSSRALKRDLEVRVLSVGNLKPPDIVFQYVISTSDNGDHEEEEQVPDTYEWVGRRRGSEQSCSSVCSGVTVPYSEWECQRKHSATSAAAAVDTRYCSNVSKPPHTPEPCNTHCTLGYRVTCPESCVHARNRTVECVRTLVSTNTTQRINDKYCSGLRVPDTPDCVRECRERGAKWRWTQWSECSGRCGSNGTAMGHQVRNVWCQKFNWRSLVDPSVDHFVSVGEEECSGAGEKPVSRRGCKVREGVCGEWRVDQWSPCSKTCGPGRRRALYACVLKTHTETQILPPDYCVHNRKPTVDQYCQLIPCASYSSTNWSTCDCTTNTESRNVTCLINDVPQPDPSKCDELNLPRPTTTRTCMTMSCADYVVSEWSRDCRKYNGKMYKYRSVTCEGKSSSSGCSGPKPESKIECGEWRIESPWGGCNGSCSVGVEVRDVGCWVNGIKTVGDEDCDGAEKPATSRKCYHNCGGTVRSLPLGGTRGEEGYGGGVISGGGGGGDNRDNYYYVNNSNRGATYKWVSGAWGKCTRMTTQKSSSSSCPTPSSSSTTSPGSTFRKHRQVRCVAEVVQPRRIITTVPTSYCTMSEQPESSTNCTEDELGLLPPCPMWRLSEYTPCLVANDTEENCAQENKSSISGAVIMHGVKTRVATCFHDTTNISVALRECGDVPQVQEACVVAVRSPSSHCTLMSYGWKVGNWTGCVVEKRSGGSGGGCSGGGKGTKTRVVQCVRRWKDRVVSIVGDEYCVGGAKKSSNKSKGRRRKPRSVKECARICGGGGGGGGNKHHHHHHQVFKWVQGEWSTCSRPCGGYGLRSRRVTCHRTTSLDWIDPDPLPTQVASANNTNYCPPPKPKEYDYCMISQTCPAQQEQQPSSPPPNATYSWHTTNFSECACPENSTMTPTYSFQKRKVFCWNNKKEGKTPARHCTNLAKPKRKRKCECNVHRSCEEVRASLLSNLMQVKDGEYLMSVGGKIATVYCHGMTDLSSTPKEYVSVVNEDNNYSEIYDKRLIRPETCPRNGSRMTTCECVHDRNRRVGVTRWRKLRVNVTNLRVDVDDFTFSTSSQDTIPYASAGDCYSSTMNCPQGRFSLDFRNTSFAISPVSTWTTSGHRATMRVARKNYGSMGASQYVQGKCGGYCATCSVTKHVGLRLDVI